MVDPDVITALHDFRSTFQHSVFAHQFQVKTPDEFHDFICSMLGPQQMDAQNIKSLTESVQLGESIVVWNGSSLQYKDPIASQTAQSLCMLICGDDTVTPKRSRSIQNTLHLTDALVRASIRIAPIFDDSLREAALEWHEKALFQSHSPTEECPICHLPLPLEGNKISLRACCGKTLCLGCIWAVAQEGADSNTCPCPFCRSEPYKSNDEYLQMLKTLIKNKHTLALGQLGTHYYEGSVGLTRDRDKAFKLWSEAGEAGGDNGSAYFNIATLYLGWADHNNFHKVRYYYEKAAILGSVEARFHLGRIEKHLYENRDRTTKHFILAAEAGHKEAMKAIMDDYKNKDVQITKDDLERLLRKHHETSSEMESEGRDRGESNYRLYQLTNGV